MNDVPLDGLKHYFTTKLEQHGANARGVDWGSEERQQLCFRQLMRICENPVIGTRARGFSLLDYGCGYGALAGYLRREEYEINSYLGYDMTPAMVEHASAEGAALGLAEFTADESRVRAADYVIASGLLALKLEVPIKAWEQHVEQLLEKLWTFSKVGLAFNSLTRYSDPERMRPDLYYADPGFLFDFCKRRFSRNVALLHDYGAYEFTMLVRRDL